MRSSSASFAFLAASASSRLAFVIFFITPTITPPATSIADAMKTMGFALITALSAANAAVSENVTGVAAASAAVLATTAVVLAVSATVLAATSPFCFANAALYAFVHTSLNCSNLIFAVIIRLESLFRAL